MYRCRDVHTYVMRDVGDMMPDLWSDAAAINLSSLPCQIFTSRYTLLVYIYSMYCMMCYNYT